MHEFSAQPLTARAGSATSMIMEPNLPTTAEIESRMLAIAAELGPEKSLCPSDVARALTGNHPDQWGPLMQPIRKVAVRLAMEGRIVILRKGRAADPSDFKGVYRLIQPRHE